jgi:hypothetical protein
VELSWDQWRLLGFDGSSTRAAQMFASADSFEPSQEGVDKGQDVGLPFCGPAPDVGAVETGC